MKFIACLVWEEDIINFALITFKTFQCCDFNAHVIQLIKWNCCLLNGKSLSFRQFTWITRHFVLFLKIHETFICYLKKSLQCFISLKSNGQLAKTVCFPNKLQIYAPLLYLIKTGFLWKCIRNKIKCYFYVLLGLNELYRSRG